MAMAMAHPLGIFATDILGRVKEIRNGQVINQWGNADPQRRILSASFDDNAGLLALTRIDGSVQIMDPSNGTPYYTSEPENEIRPKTGIYLFRATRSPIRSSTLLFCYLTRVIIGSVNYSDGSFTSNNWNAGMQKIGCSSISNSERHCVFAGKTNGNLCLWDIQNGTSIWGWSSQRVRTASFQSNFRIPYTNVTAITFKGEDDRIFVAGTNHSQIWTFDTRFANNRTSNSIPIGISPGEPINALQMDNTGHIVYFGTGDGHLGCIDTRSQRGGCFGEQLPRSGNIRSIAKHPQQPFLASAGLDGYLRVWDTNAMNLFSRVYVEQKLTSVFFNRL